jgi:rhamnosyltransferase
LVSIILLTKNPGERFKLVLDRIFIQDFKNFEVIVIDSGSIDNTLNLVEKYPIRLIKIKPSEFGHGKTRNLGISLAKGKFIVFLTHDAVPKDKTWLTELLKCFNDKKVAAVYGRQIPKKGESTLDKLFYLALYGEKRIEWTFGAYASGDNIFSDANSAIRKKLLLANLYKNNIIVSEDYEWANRIMHKGYKVVYDPKAKVIHSHAYNLYGLFKRNFDIGVSYRHVKNFNSNTSFIKKGTKMFLKEAKYLKETGQIYLLPEVIIRDGIRFLAVFLGKNETVFPKYIKKNYLSAQRWYWL